MNTDNDDNHEPLCKEGVLWGQMLTLMWWGHWSLSLVFRDKCESWALHTLSSSSSKHSRCCAKQNLPLWVLKYFHCDMRLKYNNFVYVCFVGCDKYLLHIRVFVYVCVCIYRHSRVCAYIITPYRTCPLHVAYQRALCTLPQTLIICYCKWHEVANTSVWFCHSLNKLCLSTLEYVFMILHVITNVWFPDVL